MNVPKKPCMDTWRHTSAHTAAMRLQLAPPLPIKLLFLSTLTANHCLPTTYGWRSHRSETHC